MTAAAALKAKPSESKTDSGVAHKERAKLADALSGALADTYLLFLKTQNFHWNVVGPLFYGLHKLTEEQYEDLGESADTLAERIRAIGFLAPGSFAQFSKLSEIKEESGTPTAEEMIKQLVHDNELCAKRFRDVAEAAEEVNDVKTADLLTERIGQHEENAWMLRSLLA